MQTLISIDSNLYRRRLVRALNALPDGFYHSGHRYMQAKLDTSDGCIMARSSSFARWSPCGSSAHFWDAYGQEVVASRHSK